MAPMPEDTFFIIFSILLPQSRLLSMVTQRDLAVATWVTRKSLIASVGETVTILSLFPDPIDMNSVSITRKVRLMRRNLLKIHSNTAFLLTTSTKNLSQS